MSGDLLAMPKRTRKVFTPSEDQLIISLVAKFGDKDWRIISEGIPNRTPHQCRERYRYYLSPDVVNGPWTAQEDMLLVEKYNEFGPRWSLIQPFFPGRSDINIKNRWTAHKRKARKEAERTEALSSSSEGRLPYENSETDVKRTNTVILDAGTSESFEDIVIPEAGNDIWDDVFSDIFMTY